MSESRIRVGILGATGCVGQKLVTLLARHPWFQVTAVAASERTAGRLYREAVHWLEPEPVPPVVGDLVLASTEPPLECDLVLSALDAAVARAVEAAFAEAGTPVVSNASAWRMHPAVPLVVPEVNPDHLDLLESQRFGEGFIVTNPNCSTTGLVLALKPLHDAFGLDGVSVTTMQAVSGAGYPGVSSLDVLGNVVPFIAGEEEKIETETVKILGEVGADPATATLRVSATATRVPVVDGHLLSVAVRLRRPATVEETRAAYTSFRGAVAHLALPSAPARCVELCDDDAGPQPRLHAGRGGGMTVSVGRLRGDGGHHLRFVALVHNTVRGAAGAALLNAELLRARGLLERRRPHSLLRHASCWVV